MRYGLIHPFSIFPMLFYFTALTTHHRFRGKYHKAGIKWNKNVSIPFRLSLSLLELKESGAKGWERIKEMRRKAISFTKNQHQHVPSSRYSFLYTCWIWHPFISFLITGGRVKRRDSVWEGGGVVWWTCPITLHYVWDRCGVIVGRIWWCREMFCLFIYSPFPEAQGS